MRQVHHRNKPCSARIHLTVSSADGELRRCDAGAERSGRGCVSGNRRNQAKQVSV